MDAIISGKNVIDITKWIEKLFVRTIIINW